jgi:hypothetical protein
LWKMCPQHLLRQHRIKSGERAGGGGGRLKPNQHNFAFACRHRCGGVQALSSRTRACASAGHALLQCSMVACMAVWAKARACLSDRNPT